MFNKVRIKFWNLNDSKTITNRNIYDLVYNASSRSCSLLYSAQKLCSLNDVDQNAVSAAKYRDHERLIKYSLKRFTHLLTRIYNRHGVFDTNRLRLIIYTPLIASQLKRIFDPTTFGISLAVDRCSDFFVHFT